MPRKAGQSRLELAQVNVNIMKDIASKIVPVAPNALYVIVSNPVDVLTYVFHTGFGVPENHIIGSGTILDTSRLQAALARRFHISPKNVHAHVYGEHGDSSFVPWSLVHIANNHIDSYRDHSPDKDSIEWNGPADYADMEEFVKKSGAQVIKNKGATFYAVAVSVCHLCKCLQSTAGTALTVSTLMHGEYGVDDVCLSTLALVDRTGVRGKILNHLTEDEIAKLRHSAECHPGRHRRRRDLRNSRIHCRRAARNAPAPGIRGSLPKHPYHVFPDEIVRSAADDLIDAFQIL